MGPAARRTAQQTRPAGSHECWSATKLAQHNPSSRISAKKLARRAIKHPFWAIFRVLGELFRAYTMTTVPQGELFRARTHTPGRAGRITSRTGLRNMATLKPTTPLHTHNKGPMKPASPLHPKNTPKTPISHPQRRWRFQLPHLTGPQRRRWFQTTRPPDRQGQAAAPAGLEAMSDPAISHLAPPTRTWAR